MSSYFFKYSILSSIRRSLSFSFILLSLSMWVKITKILSPFSLISVIKNFMHDSSSNYIFARTFNTIRTVLIVILFIEELLLSPFSLGLSVVKIGLLALFSELILKQPNILLSMICRAFEYFWKIFDDFYYWVSYFCGRFGFEWNLPSNSNAVMVRFWSVSFIFCRPSMLYFLFFLISYLFMSVDGS